MGIGAARLPGSFRFPDGETLYEVQRAKLVETIERLRIAHPNQTVAIFSHGDVIRTTLAHYLGTPIDLFQRVAISTASVSAISLFRPGRGCLFTNYLADITQAQVKLDEENHDSHGKQDDDHATTAAATPG